MAIKRLSAEDTGYTYDFTFTLDDTAVLADGTPNPDFIRHYSYGKHNKAGQVTAPRVALAEATRCAQHDRNRLLGRQTIAEADLA